MSPPVLDRSRATVAPDRDPTARTRPFALPEVRWATVATVLFVLGLAAQFGGAPAWLWWALYLACYVTGGWEPALAGLRALREKSLDVDLLMVVAAIGAAAIGQVLDGGLLIVIFATSGALEALLTQRTAESVRSLLDLAPERATVITESGDETVVDAAALSVGDMIVVRPGERIGADGQVIAGASEVDQATITGEPLPVAKHPGDEVFAGTLNGTGVLRVRVDRAAADTVVARIVAMVQEASATKAKAQLFIEKVEQYYSLGVVAATLAVFFVPLALGAALQPTLLRAMTFMIVASPCAVVLATMPPLLAAMANAGRNGVLVKSAVVMEQLGGDHRRRVRQDRHPHPGHTPAGGIRGARRGALRRRHHPYLGRGRRTPQRTPAGSGDRRRRRRTRPAAAYGRGVRLRARTRGPRHRRRPPVEVGSPRHLCPTLVPRAPMTAAVADWKPPARPW